MQMNQQPGGMNNMSNPMMSGMVMAPQAMPMGNMGAAMAPQPSMMMPGASRGGNRQLDDSTLFVGNLPKHLNEERLFPIFASHGNVISTRILKDSYTGDSRGFGFVTFQNKNNAKNALEGTRWLEIDGNVITVSWKNDKPKNFPVGSNLYIANLAPEVSERELFESLDGFPELVSVFIKRRDGGMSCGYGYAQFRTAEAAARCIEGANGQALRGQSIKVEVFKKRSTRGGMAQKNNLYVRGFSGDVNTSEESVNAYIDKVFGAFGKILSKKAVFSEKYGAFSAFVAFEDHQNADSALKELQNEEIDGQKLVVVWALTKEQRAKEFEKNRNGKNETNFIIKSLRTDVTKEKLAEVFGRFGKVASTHVRQHEFKGAAAPAGDAAKDKTVMGMGFVSFASSEEARNCFTNAKNDQEVLALLHASHRPNAEFLCYHQPKVMRNKYNNLRRKNSSTIGNYQKLMANMLRQLAAMNSGGNNRRGGPRGRNGPSQQDFMKFQQQQMMMMQMMRNPMMAGMPNQQMNMQAAAQQHQANLMAQQAQQQAQQQQQQMQVPNDVSWLKNNLDEFRSMDTQQQKTILGTQMYNQVMKLAPGPHVPKITGMLIDQEVLGITEIAEILSNEALLKERIDEAIKIIEEDNGKDQQ